MKPLIKAAIVYKADLPAAEYLRSHLKAHPFTDPLSLQAMSLGFVPPIDGEDDLIAEFEGGVALALRVDTKIIPGSVIKARAKQMARNIESTQGYKPGRKQMAEIKDEALFELLPRALVKSTVVHAFYTTATKDLIVATSSKALSDHVTHMLVKAVESVEFTSIYVSGIVHGLTARLRNWLVTDGDNDDVEFYTGDNEKMNFGTFEPHKSVQLVKLGDGKERVSVNIGAMSNSKAGLLEALDAGFDVAAIRLCAHNDLVFTFTDKFNFRAIDFPEGFEQAPDRNQFDAWRHEAAVETLTMSCMLTNLISMFSYEAPTKEDE